MEVGRLQTTIGNDSGGVGAAGKYNGDNSVEISIKLAHAGFLTEVSVASVSVQVESHNTVGGISGTKFL
jgi:hypothetical protein